jgi:hypothetical protein
MALIRLRSLFRQIDPTLPLTPLNAYLESSIALFEKSLERLIARTYAIYDEETAEHQKWRATLLGPYDRQLEAYREEQRRKRKANEAEKKPEPKVEGPDKETN